MSEENIEELENYTRRELDEIAESLGLKSADYPNKRSIAEAILKARAEQRERTEMEQKEEDTKTEREVDIQELKKKMTEDTVKGKIAAINLTAKKMHEDADKMLQEGVSKLKASVADMQSGIQKQVTGNKKAADAFYSGVQDLQSLIQGQMKKNQEAAASMKKGIEEIQVGIKEMEASIKDQVAEIQTYIKNFYG